MRCRVTRGHWCACDPQSQRRADTTGYRRKDGFYQRAKREGYRSRAAYKLLEIHEKERVLGFGARVVDLGCWPGGWLQVASEAVGPEGRVVGVDLDPVEVPPEHPNAIAIRGDLADAATLQKVRDALCGPADVVLCDAAPKLTGVRPTDRAREEALLESIDAALGSLLRPGGTLLLKILESPEAQQGAARIRGRFGRAKTLRPRATRKGSTERYLLARDFRG